MNADGLSCLITVGRASDQNHQQYMLRGNAQMSYTCCWVWWDAYQRVSGLALGELLLYLDGMYGVMNSPETIQWVYSLVTSKVMCSKQHTLQFFLYLNIRLWHVMLE